tara:strand:+ start:916 stop:1155 length:240 start_codon:yes stop_codon:yes gene_type:complete
MMTKENIIDRDKLQSVYVNSIVDGMDWKTMERYVHDNLNESLDDYTLEELITEVEDYYPELLEEDTVKITFNDEPQEAS